MLRKKLNPHTEVIRMPRRRILKIVEQRFSFNFASGPHSWWRTVK